PDVRGAARRQYLHRARTKELEQVSAAPKPRVEQPGERPTWDQTIVAWNDLRGGPAEIAAPVSSRRRPRQKLQERGPDHPGAAWVRTAARRANPNVCSRRRISS